MLALALLATPFAVTALSFAFAGGMALWKLITTPELPR
jgi:hypothetical protein